LGKYSGLNLLRRKDPAAAESSSLALRDMADVKNVIPKVKYKLNFGAWPVPLSLICVPSSLIYWSRREDAQFVHQDCDNDNPNRPNFSGSVKMIDND
jgi:hypothetical protein